MEPIYFHFMFHLNCCELLLVQGSQADKYDVWVLVEPRVSDVQIKDAFCSCPVGDGGSFARPVDHRAPPRHCSMASLTSFAQGDASTSPRFC